MFFDSDEALKDHKDTSRQHWICYRCGNLDFHTQVDLYDHFLEDRDHNWCTTCERDFGTPSNLHSVQCSTISLTAASRSD